MDLVTLNSKCPLAQSPQLYSSQATRYSSSFSLNNLSILDQLQCPICLESNASHWSSHVGHSLECTTCVVSRFCSNDTKCPSCFMDYHYRSIKTCTTNSWYSCRTYLLSVRPYNSLFVLCAHNTDSKFLGRVHPEPSRIPPPPPPPPNHPLHYGLIQY